MSSTRDRREDRDDRGRSRPRHARRSKRDHEDASVDSGYGGSATASPKLSRDDAPWGSQSSPSRHHAKSGRRTSPSKGHQSPSKKNSSHGRQDGPDSDTDYDPRDVYYIDVDDDDYGGMSFRGEAPKDSLADKDRLERPGSDISTPTGRRDRDRSRHRSSPVRHRDPVSSSPGNESSHRRKRPSSRDPHISSTRADSRDERSPASSRYSHSKASAASHSRHESNYRSLSPIPSDSWADSDDDSPASPRKTSSRRSPRGGHGGKSKKGSDAPVKWIDPDGETPQSFLQKLTKGIDIKSVGRVGLDAAAVAAIKVAVGTRVPWQQRIPKTIAAGAAAAIMDFVMKKTAFKPKGMVGTMFARQFVEIILANLIVNPMSNKVSGMGQKMTGGGKALKGISGGGGGGRGGGGGGGGRGRR